MKQKYYWMTGIVALIGIIMLFGCIQQEKPKTENQEIQIVYSIGGGNALWTETLTINNNGSVIRLVKSWQTEVEEETTKSIQLSDEELQEIKRWVIDAEVFKYKDRYDCKLDCPTDTPGVSIKFIIDGINKTVSMHAPINMPESLKQIMEKIKSIEKKLNPLTEKGILAGKVNIGPLCPIERNPPDPSCQPTEETYRSWPIVVWTSDKKTKVSRINVFFYNDSSISSIDGTYMYEFPAGNYIVDLEEQPSMVGSSNLPAAITISSGETTTLNIDIDTGIR